MSCDFQFYGVDILKYKDKTNSNLMFGILLDETLNFNYGEKITSGKDLPTSTLQDFFRTKFDAEKDKVELWEEDDEPAVLKEKGTAGVERFAVEVMPTVHPEKIQPKLSLTFKDANVIMSGRPDVVEKSGQIIDNKTAKASKPETYIKQSPQPVTYSTLLEHMKGGLALTDQEIRFDVLVKTKKPKIQQLKDVITAEKRAAYLKVVANLIELLKIKKEKKNFPPTAYYRGGWECGYCPVAELCRATWGLDIPESKLVHPSALPLSKKHQEEAEGQFKEKIKHGKIQEALGDLEKAVQKNGIVDPEAESKRSIIV